MTIWVTGTVVNIKHWTDQLFTIIVRAPIDMFIAGQFVKIRMNINNAIVQRAYSYLNAPDDPNLEFYITTISTGKMTPFLSSLHVNNTIMLTKKSYGHFVLEEIPNCENLWMLATGTGISPYLSILASHDEKLDKFSNIILIYATKFVKNLNYLSKMMNFKRIYREKLHIQTVLSRERSICSLNGRIPDLIENDLLEKKIGLNLDIKNSHVMLCGNPAMIRSTKKVLKEKYGMKDHVKRNRGHITQERYW